LLKNPLLCALCFVSAALAETHTMTLKQAVETALKNNPDIILSRLDEQKARASVRVAKDPFEPKVYGGSGLAYTNGYPNSIEGSAPSIFQVRTDMALFNRPKSYELAEARENARGATIDASGKADDVAYRTASLFLDAQELLRNAQSLAEEVQALQRVDESVQLRLNEGRELPLVMKRADLDLARARQRVEAATADLTYLEESLAVVLGFTAGDRVQPADDDRMTPDLPETEEASVASALEHNREMRRIQSQMQAKAFEARARGSERLPQVDLVAQYALFAKYNYVEYFTKFQRNNGQLGVSIRLPLLVGSAPSGLQAEAEVDLAKLRTQVSEVRNRTVLETRKSYQDVKRAESARDFSKLDLEVAREQVRVLLDQLDEGRTTRQAVDEGRMMEQEKWIAYYESQHVLEKAKLNLLRQTGTIQAALR
jgi:outer membrane protein TolC